MRAATGYDAIVPVPVSTTVEPGVSWTLRPDARIGAAGDAAAAGAYLAELLRPLTGFALPVGSSGGDVEFVVTGEGAAEAYKIDVSAEKVVITAGQPEGLFHGVQTLLQLLPVTGDLVVPGGTVVDAPRYAFRSFSLDICRHFFTPGEVKRITDHLARYKFNFLHLHLTEDQGWRIEIDGRPELTSPDKMTEVGGGPGGFWTQAEYQDVVAYAAGRGLTVVPEIDMPGHTHAAILAYPAFGNTTMPLAPYDGIEVGFSDLDETNEDVWTFLDDVLGQIAAITPGPWLHIGGDEALTMTADRYQVFMRRAQELVAKHGKQVWGWHQLAGGPPVSGALLGYWNSGSQDAEKVAEAVAKHGAKVVMAPADHTYVDMKYDEQTELGLKWAGVVDIDKSYEWEPSTHLPGVPADAVVGVEGAIWGETVRSMADAEFLMFPRLAAVAEKAWSPEGSRDLAAFRSRVAAQEKRWEAAGVNFAKRL